MQAKECSQTLDSDDRGSNTFRDAVRTRPDIEVLHIRVSIEFKSHRRFSPSWRSGLRIASDVAVEGTGVLPWCRSKSKADLDVALWDFADWAFGADGLPNLKILAYGKFPCSPNCEVQALVLCRNTPLDESKFLYGGCPPDRQTFRVMTRRDREAQRLLEDNMDFMSACPYNSYYEPDLVVGPRCLEI